MKKFKLYSLAAASLLLGMTSCSEDFLTEEPASSLPIDTYYNTYEHIMESAVAAYDPMQWFDYFAGWAPLNLVWDSMGDDIYVGGGSTSDQQQIHLISQYRSDPSNNIDGAWTTCYSGINRSIRLIDNANNSTELTDEQRRLFDAEGRAMRAWYYLVLWKTWGNVPYYEANLTFPYVTRQYTAQEVYDAVTTDLESVLDSDVLPMNQPDEWKGRMTQAAAAMIYADYVMYQADESKYNKALSYMESIINSREYDLVSVEELWDVKNEWNKEIIWDVNYASKGGKRDWGSANTTGGTVLPQLIGIDGYSTSEAEPEFSAGGWGFCTVSKEVYDAYDDKDLRRDLGILNIDKYIKDKSEEGDLVYYGGRYQNTGYFLRKYLPRPGGNDGYVASDGLNWDYNLHLYRYAETLLNAAELALETGNGKAQEYYDLVRRRAGLGSRTVSIDNLLDERRLEFVGEGKRYFDLVRTGKAASVLKAGAGVVQTVKGYYFEKDKDGKEVKDLEHLRFQTPVWSGTAIPERQNWTENKKYIQIPQSEIEATASKGEEFAIKQNPS
jgi:hypothetical protein